MPKSASISKAGGDRYFKLNIVLQVRTVV